jgi:hypothetical protein
MALDQKVASCLEIIPKADPWMSLVTTFEHILKDNTEVTGISVSLC